MNKNNTGLWERKSSQNERTHTGSAEDLAALKLVIAGPVGSGKTTAIRSVADSEPVSTEMPMSSGPMGDKTTTTVAFDFSTILLDDQSPLFVYGLPGQSRFEHMWSIILEGAIGVVLVLDASDPDIENQCSQWVSSLSELDASLPMVVGVTKTDVNTSLNLRALRASLSEQGHVMPVFSFDARDPEQTRHLIRSLLVALE